MNGNEWSIGIACIFEILFKLILDRFVMGVILFLNVKFKIKGFLFVIFYGNFKLFCR